jgi:hypothetical protein
MVRSRSDQVSAQAFSLSRMEYVIRQSGDLQEVLGRDEASNWVGIVGATVDKHAIPLPAKFIQARLDSLVSLAFDAGVSTV